MHNELFAAALGLADPWFVAGLDFEKSGARPRLTIRIDFRPKSRFAVEEGGPECTAPGFSDIVEGVIMRRWRTA